MGRSLGELTPFARAWAEEAIRFVERLGGRVTVTSTKRSRAEQAKLYRRYRLGLTKYPAAPPGASTHEKGIAFDLAVTPRSLLNVLGRAWEAAGYTWGGRF